MFDIGAAEFLVIAIVAILVIGPKDMPLALRTAGRWIGQIRRVSGHFRAGLDAMVREAEMEDMEKKWKERNAQIMREHPGDEMTPLPPPQSDDERALEPAPPPADSADRRDSSPPDPDADDPAPEIALPPPASAEARAGDRHKQGVDKDEPRLPLDGESRS